MIDKQIQNAKRSYESIETDVDQVMQQVQNHIANRDRTTKRGMVHNKRSHPLSRRLAFTIAGSVAAFAIVIGSGFASPVMASVLQEIPLVGSVFQYVHDSYNLKTASEKGMTAHVGQSVHDNGITLQIQEVMYDGDRLSIGYIQQTEGQFSNQGGPLEEIQFKIDGKPYTSPKFASGPSASESKNYNGFIGGSGPFPIDSKTSAGEITLDSFYQKLPDEFELGIEVNAVAGVQGQWDFSIPVKKTVSNIKTWLPMMSATDGETSLLIKKISFKPGSMDVEFEYRRPASKAQDPMYNIQAFTNTGIELKSISMRGNGYVEDETHIQTGTFLFELPSVTPKSITFRPYLHGDVTKYGIKVPMEHEPSDAQPLVIPQGELGRLLVTKVEHLKDKTVVHYTKEGHDPLHQAELIMEDLEKEYDFKPWDIHIIPDTETNTKLVDAQNNMYVTEFPAMSPDQQPVFITHEYQKPVFPKELEMTIPVP
ncbi:DUF4179 domain-containing protein [Paenibacillus faecalis]|uniref:DUF4179 domain-containing protein n=1 Tax=Paenibacillus faecalis TaxID=2079532 RepID=UPI000D0F366F|nr:DUF4179 domain-containing protein [Paenibacillus faecalis]